MMRRSVQPKIRRSSQGEDSAKRTMSSRTTRTRTTATTTATTRATTPTTPQQTERGDDTSEEEAELPPLELEPRFDIESPIVIEVTHQESDPTVN